ncbi:MAG: laccase domain-containing protein, partial [Muribaculaceae bacterium]|nr:laccase domain-containing protein [Muribaculaceae bacterium]
TGKAHIDLPEANRIIALQSGVPDANINLSGRCTRCQPMRYFSARRIGIRSGRIFTAIIRRSL